MYELGHHLPIDILADLAADPAYVDAVITHPNLTETTRATLLPQASLDARRALLEVWPVTRHPDDSCFTELVRSLDCDGWQRRSDDWEDAIWRILDLITADLSFVDAVLDHTGFIASTHDIANLLCASGHRDARRVLHAADKECALRWLADPGNAALLTAAELTGALSEPHGVVQTGHGPLLPLLVVLRPELLTGAGLGNLVGFMLGSHLAEAATHTAHLQRDCTGHCPITTPKLTGATTPEAVLARLLTLSRTEHLSPDHITALLTELDPGRLVIPDPDVTLFHDIVITEALTSLGRSDLTAGYLTSLRYHSQWSSRTPFEPTERLGHEMTDIDRGFYGVVLELTATWVDLEHQDRVRSWKMALDMSYDWTGTAADLATTVMAILRTPAS